MREVIATGRTVEEATEAGCAELGLGRDAVSVEILELPQKKLFKTLPAKVKVTDTASADEPAPEPPAPARAPEAARQRPAAPAPAAQKWESAPEKAPPTLPAEPEELIDLENAPRVKQAADYLAGIFAAMGATGVKLEACRQGDATLFRVEGEEIAQKIEIRGEVIQALSYLVDRAANSGVDKKEEDYLRVRLDVAGYRNRRESELLSLAQRTGKEVARTGRSRTLAPMNPYERLIIHTAISNMEGLTSESIGADTERRVVVKSTAPNATDGGDWIPPRHGSGHGGGRESRGPRRDDRAPRSGGGRGDRGGYRHSGGGHGGRDGGRDGSRDARGPRSGGDRDRFQRSSTPEREYANRPRNTGEAPVVPERREAIKDGENLPLYGKIEL